MKDIRNVLSDLNSGSIKVSEIPDELIFQLSSSMLIEQLEGPDEILSRLSPLPVSYTHLTLPTKA